MMKEINNHNNVICSYYVSVVFEKLTSNTILIIPVNRLDKMLNLLCSDKDK